MNRGFLGIVAAACLLSVTAAAQSISDQARKAQMLAGQGNYIGAIDALDNAADLLWQKSPLVCRRILWVAERAPNFGDYNIRDNNIYRAGEDMLAYAEPVGFGWRKSGDIWHTDMVADFIIRGKNGKELFRKNDFGKFDIGSRVRNREFRLNLTYNVKAPPGDYVAITHLRDKVTGKAGDCALPFTIK